MSQALLARSFLSDSCQFRGLVELDQPLPALQDTSNKHTYGLQPLNAYEQSLIASDQAWPGARQAMESLVKRIFKSAHGASLSAFLPELFALLDGQQNPMAVVGIRHITDTPIFLEQYLDLPIEQQLGQWLGHTPKRESIVEVGNLAAECAGASRLLIAFLVLYLHKLNIRWAVCTGTRAVRAALARTGVGYALLHEADPKRLGESRHAWGRYYQHNPLVLAVDVAGAYEHICKHYFCWRLN